MHRGYQLLVFVDALFTMDLASEKVRPQQLIMAKPEAVA